MINQFSMNIATKILLLLLLLVGGFYWLNGYIYNEKQDDSGVATQEEGFNVTPISHASMILSWDGVAIYNDPVGSVELYVSNSTPDIILLSDIHGDHLSVPTLEGLVTESTQIIAPQAVYEQLSVGLQNLTTVMANGETLDIAGFTIEAMPMYNLPESEDSPHVRGRGNGYVLERNGMRVYIAGDTADITEMRSLENIDVAFIPMNLPYTMGIEDAADAVLEFKPKKVYPYHYRTPNGPSNIMGFKRIINENTADIEVVLLDWYAE